MCGRAALTASPEDLAEMFGVTDLPELEPRYNIAPTEPMAVIRTPGRLELLRFGLVPSFARDPKEGTRFINARAETVATQSVFREAYKKRRCLVVVSGFYEWQAQGKKKQPFYVHRPDGKPFALAGLWATWRSRDGEVIDSCAVITRTPSEMLAAVHDRMPVVLAPDEYATWIDPHAGDVHALLEGHAGELEMYPISPAVNRAGTSDPRMIEPLPST